MRRIVVGTVRELPPGSRRILEVDGQSIGVLNVEGTYYALRNSCPHQGGPVCLGWIGGTNLASRPYELVYARENEIIKCPWHGWEFEIATGRSVFNPHKVRVRTYEVTIEGPEDEDLEDQDPSLPTYAVTVEDDVVILHV